MKVIKWLFGGGVSNADLAAETAAREAADAALIPLAQKGAINGVGTLDADGLQPITQVNPSLLSGDYKGGTWNAATGATDGGPNGSGMGASTLGAAPVGNQDKFHWITATAGTFHGTSYAAGDWIEASNGAWVKIKNNDAVVSVFGRIGAVVATLGDYAASLITNDSSVPGATIKDALNNLFSVASPHKGAYSSGTAYVPGQMVTYLTATFICISATTGNAPTNATYWTKIGGQITETITVSSATSGTFTTSIANYSDIEISGIVTGNGAAIDFQIDNGSGTLITSGYTRQSNQATGSANVNASGSASGIQGAVVSTIGKTESLTRRIFLSSTKVRGSGTNEGLDGQSYVSTAAGYIEGLSAHPTKIAVASVSAFSGTFTLRVIS